METDTIHLCLMCGKELHGRTDKRFCDDKCRHDYHNRAISISNKIRSETLKQLYSNYEILQKLLSFDIRSISISEAGKMGFRTEIMSSCRKLSRGQLRCACFDIGYNLKTDSIERIIRNVR